MNRRIISVILTLILCLSLAFSVSAASADEQLIYDEANLLTDAEEASLSHKLLDISHTYNAQITVITVASVEDGDVAAFADFTYDAMELGYGSHYDGVLLMICMNPREYRIISNGMAADAISTDDIASIGDAIVSDLSDGYYAEAFDAFADQCAYYLDGHSNGFPFDAGTSLLIALVVGVIAGVVVALVLRGQLITVRKQAAANVYVKSGSMQLTHTSDRFLYRNVTKSAKPKNNSSSSGSSRNSGGGSF